MVLLPPLGRVADATEHLDRPVPLPDLTESLRDVARLNGLCGGRWLTLRHVRRLLAGLPADRPVTVVDVGTGSGDIPLALVRWARRRGRRLRVLALDRDRSTLGVARRLAAGAREIGLVQGDACALPVRPGAADVVISALTLHHLEPARAAQALREMDRSTRIGLVVNDLLRSRAGWALVWVATRLLARSALSRHDGPLSVLRAYTPAELSRLCEGAGLTGVRVWRYPALVRLCAVRVKA
jgi:2-polyprenyl-3-methyl-5-hydroxy-6-metoxy-1,4-benzoquinol methylase